MKKKKKKKKKKKEEEEEEEKKKTKKKKKKEEEKKKKTKKKKKKKKKKKPKYFSSQYSSVSPVCPSDMSSMRTEHWYNGTDRGNRGNRRKRNFVHQRSNLAARNSCIVYNNSNSCKICTGSLSPR